MNSVKTLPEFASLTEKDIEQALDKLDELSEEELAENVHPILAELERLIGAYSERFEALCNEHGEVPAEILTFEPEKPIEQTAFDIFSDALHDSLQEEDNQED